MHVLDKIHFNFYRITKDNAIHYINFMHVVYECGENMYLKEKTNIKYFSHRIYN